MSLFDRLHGFLQPGAHAKHAKKADDENGTHPPHPAQPDHAWVEQMFGLDPTLRLASHASARLSAALAVALDYAGELARALPPARAASAATWASDPCIHAFFAAPGDVARTLGRAVALRAWFNAHPLARETYALLDMALSARHVTGVARQGDAVRTDVAQTTLSFDDHQIDVCGESQRDLQQQIVQRVVTQTALDGLAQLDADASRRSALERERALLKARLQWLEHRETATRVTDITDVTPDTPDDQTTNAAKAAQLRADIDENDRELARFVASASTLEHRLDAVCDALAHPDAHVHMKTQRAYLNPMNVVIEEDARAASDAVPVTFLLARFAASASGERALLPIRFARADWSAMPGTSDANGPVVI